MKKLLICGSILAGATMFSTLAAQAQTAPTEKPAPGDPIQLGRPQNADSKTPALDAFAGAGQMLQLRVRWVQIERGALTKALPAWSQAGQAPWTRIASPRELQTLWTIEALGAGSISDRQLLATNNQIANLSFAPFTKRPTIIELYPDASAPAPGPTGPERSRRMVTPFNKLSPDALLPDMPNWAKTELPKPKMAPMPNMGGKTDSPSVAPVPNTAPKPKFSAPQKAFDFSELIAYRFQLRPTLSGKQVALELRTFDAAGTRALNAATATVKLGETIVFALPNARTISLDRSLSSRERSGFLLVTPELPKVTLSPDAPAQP